MCRAMAMTHPGMFLSQPGRAMQASWCCAHVTVSMLSAMISLVWRENRIPRTMSAAHRSRLCLGVIPSPPMVIASETPMVLYCHASIPCFSTALFTVRPRSSTVSKPASACSQALNTDSRSMLLALFGRLTMHATSKLDFILDNRAYDNLLARVPFPPN